MMKKPEIQEPSEDQEGGAPVRPAREALLAEEEEAEEGGLEEEGEDAFHGEGHADDAAGAAGELAQLVPNWNSMGMPVTTPSRKLTAKILAQKRAATSYFASSRLAGPAT